MSPEFTEEDCKQILEKLQQSNQFQSCEVVPFRNPLLGLVGEHYTLQIQLRNGDELKFFVKALSKNPYLLELTKLLCMYDKEEFFYSTLLEAYKRSDIDVSFAPVGYLFKNYTTVLEDLDVSGYKGTKKWQLLDYDHCKICLRSLAKFHSAALNYETKTQSKLITTHAAILADKFASDQDNAASRWLKSSIQGLLQLIDLQAEDSRISRDNFKEKFLATLDSKSTSRNDLYSVIHNDLWTSNFLYLYNKDGRPIDAKILDFQQITHGPVQLDLMKFLMTTTSKELRSEHSKELLYFYYDELESLLDNKQLLPGKKEFLESCDDYRIAGKVHAIVDHSFTFLSDELYTRATESEEEFRRFLFEDRGLYVAEAFNTSKDFREMLSADILELRDFFV